MAHMRRVRSRPVVPTKLSDKRRALLARRLRAARERLREAKDERRALQKTHADGLTFEGAARELRKKRRAEHAARHRVRMIKRQLGLPTALQRWMRSPQVQRRMQRNERSYLEGLATSVGVSVSYAGAPNYEHDKCGEQIAQLFNGVVLGSGYSFAREERDLDFRFHVASIDDAPRIQAMLSAFLSNIPATCVQITAWVVHFVDGK